MTLFIWSSVMSWLLDGMVTLISGGILVIFRVWLESKWKDK